MENKLFLLKTNYRFNLILYQAGYEECDSFHSYGPVARDFYVIHFVTDGEGTLEIADKRYQLRKGDLFLLPKGQLSRYRTNPANPYKYYWVGFSGVNDKEILNAIGFSSSSHVIHLQDRYDEILNIFKEIDLVKNDVSLKDNLIVLSMLFKLFSSLVNVDIQFKSSNEKKETIELLTSYIEKNFETQITMSTLEKIANMHRSNIYRLFLANYGIAPTEYIRNVRLENALYLLKNTDYSIKKIAISCGFTDTVYFCKVFKSVHKKTPSDTRQLK